MRTTYHCENCNVKFPVEDERFGLCRECNEGCGFCYECEKKDEKISKLESSNEMNLENRENEYKFEYSDYSFGLKGFSRVRTVTGMVAKEQESKGNHKTAKLIASAPDMLELLKNILVEVRPEISRVNELHDQTIFNPVATETIDMAREIINKAEGKQQ